MEDVYASSLQNAENSFAVALDTRVVSVTGPAAVIFTQLQPVVPKTDLRMQYDSFCELCVRTALLHSKAKACDGGPPRIERDGAPWLQLKPQV